MTYGHTAGDGTQILKQVLQLIIVGMNGNPTPLLKSLATKKEYYPLIEADFGTRRKVISYPATMTSHLPSSLNADLHTLVHFTEPFVMTLFIIKPRPITGQGGMEEQKTKTLLGQIDLALTACNFSLKAVDDIYSYNIITLFKLL
jgi:hypothetical protein